MTVTADSITNDQIRELRRAVVSDDTASSMETDAVCSICMIALDDGRFRHQVIREARASCAALINNRAAVLKQLEIHPRECTCVGSCKGASGLAPGWSCVMSKKSPTRCQARKHRHPNHVDDVCEGNCCTTCGGPIDSNQGCRCG